MTELYFVRHAHADYSEDEYHRPLSLKGIRDVDRVTALLNDQRIDAIYSSPYKRAIKTVQGIAKYHDVPIKIVEALKERRLANGTMEDFQEAIQRVWQEPSFAWAGGESNEQAMRRAIQSLQSIILSHPHDSLVIGTHGNIMVLMMQSFDAQYGYDFWQRLSMPDVYRLSFRGLTLVEVERVWQKG
ncbi:phosphoglycerate mutase [Lysinibacillus sphaericus]|uniref:histidine phosphatase family protein n=1 Tax=Lysinibacillus sphaericus TaxID=1421 RepID=UPI0018CEAF73|nr:histidine phosphatase family protein [Lysinibacillus sphaericus]MBG9691323.1 phosphoglycerate mutase [Lysinibacillus sphaericus]